MKKIIATVLMAFSSLAYADMQLGVSVYPNNLYAVVRFPNILFMRVQAMYGIEQIGKESHKKAALGYQTRFLKTKYVGIVGESSVGYVFDKFPFFDAKLGGQIYYKNLSVTTGMGLLSNLTSKENITKNTAFPFIEGSVDF